VRQIPAVCALLATLALVGVAAAQEYIPPVVVGGGQTVTKVTNGQVVEVVAIGVSASVNFYEISAARVTGLAVRTSGGTSSGTVTIRWISMGREQSVHLGPQIPEAPFGMEGGDIDRRSGAQVNEP
jgi:hypothetical protein